MVPKSTNMADNDRPPTEAQDYAPQRQSPVSMETDTRRTSNSSAGEARAEQGGSLEASQASIQTESQRRPRPQRLDYGSIRTETNTRHPPLPPGQMLSPSANQNQNQTPRRPGVRRNPSTVAPHRGETFSVDDDPDEVDSDMRLARTQSRQDERRERERERERQLRRRESTVRRRPTAQPPTLRTVESSENDEERARTTGNDTVPVASPPADNGDPSSEETLQGEEEESEEPPTPDDDADLSDAESFTLRDRQEAINETHPFGIRIWKPALYKKSRSVQRNAEGDIHSAPGGSVSRWLFIFNCLWTLFFGWWLSIVAAAGGIVSLILSVFGLPGCYDYGRVLINLSHYLFYPFGKYVKLERDEAYLDEDEAEGRSITDYERWQAGDLEEGRLFFGPMDIGASLIGRRRDEVEDLDETDSLLGRQRRQSNPEQRREARNMTKKRFFGRGKWNIGRVIFFLSFYFLITPCLFIVSGICWFMVFWIPMGKVTLLLFYHLRRHPLAMSFHTDSHYSRVPSIERGSSGSSILLCTYRAVGTKYWKYTIDGTNIFLINLLGLVALSIFDFFVLYQALGLRIWLTSLGLMFVMALASIIPLAYFIGQAVASISAQSSMGVGATVNAFFSTIVEVFLYCIALKEGKGSLVEGAIIGSIFAGILFLPGLSMCFGAIKRKTQRFNVQSAGVTSTMLLFAVIGAFGPTLFYQMYGSHEMRCHQCVDMDPSSYRAKDSIKGADRDCRRCYFDQTPALNDRFYEEAVRPYIYFATVCLFSSYAIGLLFTLRTHAAVIWNNEPDEKKEMKKGEVAQRIEGRHGSVAGAGEDQRPLQPATGSLPRENVRDSQMYKRILNQSLKQAGISTSSPTATAKKQQPDQDNTSAPQTPYLVPPKTPENDANGKLTNRITGLSPEDNRLLVQEMAEMAATAATVAARDATKAPRRASYMATTSAAPKQQGSGSSKDSREPSGGIKRTTTLNAEGASMDSDLPPDAPVTAKTTEENAAGGAEASGGHDAPNWSRAKSTAILLTATVAYAVIAEILVDTVDAVLTNIDIDEKFLGISLFALVPNTTEFLNAISFAMNGNVALSMEIGSSYALQVILLQAPALVVFSGVYNAYFIPNEADMLSHTFTLIFPQWDMVCVILSVFLMGYVIGEGKSNYFKGSMLILTYLVIVVGFYFSGFDTMEVKGVDRSDMLALGDTYSTYRTKGWQGSRGIAY